MSARSRRLRPALAAALAGAVLLSGCGYRIVGIGGQLPGGFTRVEVPVFENRTARTDIGRVLTEQFIKQLLGAAKVQVVRGEEAQAVIRGVVTGYKRDPITFDAKQRPLENRLTVVMDVLLATRGSEQVLFSEKAVTVRQDFPVGDDLQESDRSEQEALVAASELMSQKLVSLMLEGF